MGARILVVEDNPYDRSLVAFLLEAFGHAPIVATNGADAVRLAGDLEPDLILLDILMPEIDGYETLGRLRRSDGLDRTPIVALTILSRPEERATALAAGFDGYITKPIVAAGFAAQIDEFVPA